MRFGCLSAIFKFDVLTVFARRFICEQLTYVLSILTIIQRGSKTYMHGPENT